MKRLAFTKCTLSVTKALCTSADYIRLSFTSILLLLNVSILQAQIITPDATTAVPAQTGNTSVYMAPDYTTGIPVNYIRTYQPQEPTTDPNYVTSSSRTVNEVNVSTQYFDGLGRPLQTVNWQASPGKQDIVAPVKYDDFGREQYEFLPYTSPTASASGNPGDFKMFPFSEQSNFYTTTYKTEQPALANEKYFYSKTNFEPSPLNRVSESYAPGNSWAGSEGGSAEKKVSRQYLVNTSSDAVRIWHIDFNTTIEDNTNIPYSNTTDIYDAGQLYKTVTIDEAGNAVVEYKDKEGQVILKKVQIGTVATDFSGYSGFLCTYYVYDDLNQLRTVIQPKGVAALISANNWDMRQTDITILKELCFRYEYDQRQRMIAKKVPGADWVYMVYDSRDRLAFSQDGNMRAKSPMQWAYTVYDDLNRPVQTGIMAYTISRDDLAASMPATTASSTTSNTGTNQNINPADMYINSRETGRTVYQATNSIVFDNGFNSEDNASFTAQITTEAANNFTDNNITVNTYAIPSGATLYPLTYTYYEDYTATTKTYSPANNSKLDDGGNPYPETLPSTNSTQTKGMVTVTKVRVIEDANNLNAGKWLETDNFYDDKGRVIQVQSTNYKGGNDVLTNRYDFTNKVISSYVVHNNVSGNVNNLRVLTSMLYDHEGRLQTITKTINDDVANKRIIATNTYDALGKLKEKQTGQKSVSDVNPLEDDNYNYNIRGWLKDINYYSPGGTYASQMNSASSKWFSMDLSYDWGFNNNASQYNGNISGTRWKTAGDGEERAYGFAYDKANRLLKGDFTQNNSGWNTDPIVDFSMKIGDGVSTDTYDENGNIIKMSRQGVLGAVEGPVDNLTYHYYNNSSNKLSAVDDPTADTKLGDFTDNNTSGNDYGYDLNGNLVTDLNKGLKGIADLDLKSGGAITYNFLNLPSVITVKNVNGSDKGTISYIYDAIGNKLEKRVIEGTSTHPTKQTTTSYLASFVYENNVLQFFSHEEGRVRWTLVNGANAFVYDYFLKDHLGNVRMVLTEEQKIDHYPTATLEGTGTGSSIENEKAYYDINNSYVQDQPASLTSNYINDNGTNNPNTFGNPDATSLKMYRLNAATNRTGLGMLLKVMSGDKINILGKSYYHYSGGGVSNTPFDASALISAFLSVGGSSNIALIHGATTTALNANTLGTVVPLNAFSNSNPVDPNNNVKAGIAYILFDEQFKYAGGGFDPVDASSSGGLKSHVLPQVNVQKNGYIYIYCSNESNIDVLFDNLEVVDAKGPILEETHYYPFGLTMAGISSKAGGLENKFKYNGKELQHGEFSDGGGLEAYDYGVRFYDPQIARWNKIDNKAELYKNITPYAYAGNQPTNAIDPDGNLIIFINGQNLSSGGSSAYWKSPNGQNFDIAVQKHFNDLAPPRYYDGSSGGWANTVENSYNPLFSIFTDDNRIAQDRKDAGHAQGIKDAKSILIGLHRTGGVIDESLKIVTHSMGGAYAKGFVKAIVEYAKAHPEISNGLKISEFDFDPFQAGSLEVEPKVHTEQYTHNGKKHLPWWKFWDTDKIADEKQKGLEPNNPNGDNNSYTEDPSKTTHDISTFYNDIQYLQEGTYQLIDGKWVKQ
jgi:RHS repeat-associated protein